MCMKQRPKHVLTFGNQVTAPIPLHALPEDSKACSWLEREAGEQVFTVRLVRDRVREVQRKVVLPKYCRPAGITETNKKQKSIHRELQIYVFIHPISWPKRLSLWEQTKKTTQIKAKKLSKSVVEIKLYARWM